MDLVEQPLSVTADRFNVGSNNVVHNITNEVIRECSKIGVFVDENVVSLAIRLLSLDPWYGLRLDSRYDRKALEEFVNKCVQKFSGLTMNL